MNDHWRSLAEDIGAEVTEPEKQPDRTTEGAGESPPPRAADAPPQTTAPPQPAPAPRKPAAPKPKNHWQKIAGALGISFDKSEPEEESRDAEKAAPVESQVTDDAASEPVTADVEPTTTTSNLVQGAAAKETRSAFGFDAKSSTFDTPVHDRPDGIDRSGREASAGAKDLAAGATSYSKRSSREEPSQAYDPEHAKRELEALFADPVDTNAPAIDIGFSTETVVPSDERTSSYSTEDEATQNGGLPGSDSQGKTDEDQGEAKDARRPRRRRGGRRRRRKEEQPASTTSEPEPSTSEDADVNSADAAASDLDNSLPFARELECDSVESDSVESDSDESDSDESEAYESEADEGEADEGDSDEARARRGHRKIPSWQDAVGAIVDTNLESRSNNPSSGSNQGGRRRRGAGRGRRRPPQQR